EIGPAILVHVAERRIAAPTNVLQVHFFGNVLEFSSAEILIQNALLAAFRFQMARESVLIRQKKTASTFLVRGVGANVHHEQIEQTIVVEIEKYRAGRMTDIAKAGFPGDVLELLMA